MCSVFALVLMKYFPSRRLWTCHVVPIAKSQRQAGLANNLHITTATLAITANMPPSILCEVSPRWHPRQLVRKGGMYVRVGTHKRLFSEGLDTSPCVLQVQFMTVMLRVYSAEAERYIDPLWCALLAMGKKRTSCGLSLQDLEKERAPTWAAYMSLCDESHAS